MTEDDVRQLLRQHIAGTTMRKWAREHGVTHAYVSLVLGGHARPGAALLNAMGLKKTVSYEIAT